MAGWHHWLDGRESEWTPGVGDGQGGLACCDSWDRRVGHDWATELNCPDSQHQHAGWFTSMATLPDMDCGDESSATSQCTVYKHVYVYILVCLHNWEPNVFPKTFNMQNKSNSKDRAKQLPEIWRPRALPESHSCKRWDGCGQPPTCYEFIGSSKFPILNITFCHPMIQQFCS